MKRLILILAALLAAISLSAQSAVQQADAAFAAGNYTDAAQLYELAASTVAGNATERQKLYDKANRSRQVASLRNKADMSYRSGDYKAANTAYENVLKYNSRDQLAKSRIAEYKRTVLAAEKAAADSAAWDKVMSKQHFWEKAAAAGEYLSTWPEGRFAEEAASYVAEYNLWREASKLDTYESYEHYKQESVLREYVSDADSRINLIDVKAWKEARKTNTVSSFRKYIDENKGRGAHLEDAQNYIYMITARGNYYRKDMLAAYDYYRKCPDGFISENSTAEDKLILKECEEYYYFQKAASGTIEDCDYYLSQKWYHYWSEVRNRKMQLLCEQHDYDRAMDYADTPSSKKFVRNARKQWKKAVKQ